MHDHDVVNTDPFELPIEEFLDFEEACERVAATIMRFDAYVSNKQGACDVGTMESMLMEAVERAEWESQIRVRGVVS